MKIYLAGDMKSGWQDRLAPLLPAALELIDPRSHGLSEPSEYTRWDLDGVARADVVVAYMHPGNPSGFGMSLEIGYAHALGKPIIFVDGIGTDWRSPYFGMVRCVSKVVASLADVSAALATMPAWTSNGA